MYSPSNKSVDPGSSDWRPVENFGASGRWSVSGYALLRFKSVVFSKVHVSLELLLLGVEPLRTRTEAGLSGNKLDYKSSQ